MHRLFDPGSDRAADKWREDYRIAGTSSLQLHHLYRAMAWLGEEIPLPETEAPRTVGKTTVVRRTKDVIR